MFRLRLRRPDLPPEARVYFLIRTGIGTLFTDKPDEAYLFASLQAAEEEKKKDEHLQSTEVEPV